MHDITIVQHLNIAWHWPVIFVIHSSWYSPAPGYDVCGQFYKHLHDHGHLHQRTCRVLQLCPDNSEIGDPPADADTNFLS